MYVLGDGTGDIVETTIVKKSRFVATLASVGSPDDVDQLVDRVESAGATHVCPAYVIGDGPHRIARAFDDGEPAGTAGAPILAALERREVMNAAIVVVRYFGGVKLGAGGLIRAYGASATAVLDAATLVRAVPMSTVRITVPAADAGRVGTDLHTLSTVRSTSYGPDSVVFEVDVATRRVEDLRDHLLTLTSGSATIDGG